MLGGAPRAHEFLPVTWASTFPISAFSLWNRSELLPSVSPPGAEPASLRFEHPPAQAELLSRNRRQEYGAANGAQADD